MQRLVPLSFLLLLGVLAGCSSYDTQVAKGRSLTGVQRFFVLSNPNDGHALDHQIANALTNRGYQAESGPLTMMPEETQAIVTYQDHWTWDFGDHLVYLQISVRDQKTNQSGNNGADNSGSPFLVFRHSDCEGVNTPGKNHAYD